ncbi:guanyl-specific ribonuclease [Aquincola agrisoli]|uniref:ribonuclease domain-containing protein n=1 Tax=Aquincola TaxID=391952 RepID=UPI003618121A
MVQSLRKLGLTLGTAALLACAAPVAQARPAQEGAVGIGGDSVVAWSQLPAEARATERLIRVGGPFPYQKDGSVFGNRERLLPRQSRGFYREYTVKTPGVRHRGARRIVCGGRQPTQPEACYYTQDHYASFSRIVQ